VDRQVQTLGDDNYFGTSTLDISPGSRQNIVLAIIANARSIKVTNICLRFGFGPNGESLCEDIPLEKDISIVALNETPINRRLRLNYGGTPPFILENTPKIRPVLKSCRWDDFGYTNAEKYPTLTK